MATQREFLIRIQATVDDLMVFLRNRIGEDREALARQRAKHDALRAWLEERRTLYHGYIPLPADWRSTHLIVNGMTWDELGEEEP